MKKLLNTLNNIINNTKFKNTPIDFYIDAEEWMR